MDDFLKVMCAIASGCFIGFISLCVVAIVNFFGADVSTHWAFVSATLAFAFTLWDCYRYG